MSFKIIAIAETDFSELLTFGTFSLMAMAQQIFNETAQATGIHGSSAQILQTPNPDKQEITDLDILIMAEAVSPETHKRLQAIIHRHIQKRPFELKNKHGIPFGFQFKGPVLGEKSLNFSITVYTSTPETPLYDDIAHSEILLIQPRRHSTSKFPDLPFVQYLKQNKLLLTPQTHTPAKQIFRIAMREAKGWKVLNAEMDKRVYASGASDWNNSYLIGKGINDVWVEHFGRSHTTYPKLVFFMLSRLMRHSQNHESVNDLWACLSNTLALTIHPHKVTSMTELAAYLQSTSPGDDDFHRYLTPFKNHQEECLSLCTAWDACQTDASRSIILTDLSATLTHIARNALNRQPPCRITPDETAWQATLRHLGYDNEKAAHLPDALFSRVIQPTLQHMAPYERENFIHAQLSAQCISPSQYAIYSTQHPIEVETWLRASCAPSLERPSAGLLKTAAILIELTFSCSDMTCETLMQHLGRYVQLTPKPEGYDTLWKHLIRKTPLTPDVQATIHEVITPIKNWGYPDDALLGPVIERLVQTPPTDRVWHVGLEILGITHITPSALSEDSKGKLPGYTKALFSIPDWHQGFTLDEALTHVQSFFTHRPKLKGHLTQALLEAKEPSSIEDAEKALGQWLTPSFCINNPGWLTSIDYLLRQKKDLPQDVTARLWQLAIAESPLWQTAFTQKHAILTYVLTNQVRHDPTIIPQIPACHRKYATLSIDDATKITILDGATDADLADCMAIYIWNTPTLSAPLAAYRDAFIQNTQRHTPVVQTALREQAQTHHKADPALSLSIWINLPDSDADILSLLEADPRLETVTPRLYTSAITKTLHTDTPDLKTRLLALVDHLDFAKMDTTLHTQLITAMSDTQRHAFLEHTPKYVSRLSPDMQKSLLEMVSYAEYPNITDALITHIAPAQLMAIIVTKITTDAACQQSGPIIERALSQKKFRIPTLKAFFDDHIPQMPAPQYPLTLSAWRDYKKEKDAALYNALVLRATKTLKKEAAESEKNKDLDGPSLLELKIAFMDSPPEQKSKLISDCPALTEIPFYLQDIELLESMRAIIGSRLIRTPPSAIRIAIKADNVDFMAHLHGHGLSMAFKLPDHTRERPRTLLDVAIQYKSPNYYGYLFQAMRTEIQLHEKELGKLVWAAICNPLEDLDFSLQHGDYNTSPDACEKRIQQIFSIFRTIGIGNLQWNPAQMTDKASIIEGFKLLIQKGYLTLSAPISIEPALTPQAPITMALGLETEDAATITTNGLSYFLIQAGDLQPSASQLGALFMAYAIHEKNTDYAHDIESKIIKHLALGIRITPDDFSGLFKLFPTFISNRYLLPLLNVILKHQKEEILTQQNEYRPLSAIIIARPFDNTAIGLLLAAGFSPNETATPFHLAHLTLRYATADTLALLLDHGMSISAVITAAELSPMLPPIALNTLEYLHFITLESEHDEGFQTKCRMLHARGLRVSPGPLLMP